MSQIRNLTPHPVIILDPECAEYDPRTRSYRLTSDPVVARRFETEEGPFPRCTTSEEECAMVDGVPTISVVFGEVENLPAMEDGTFLVVSAIVANAAKEQGRQDVLVPSRVVRDANGGIVGCLALARQ